LNIFNYSNYIAPDTVSRFRAQTGIAVVYDEFSSQDVLFAKLKLGAGYDLVVASDYMLRRLLRQQLLAPLDDFAHRDGMMERFRHPPWDPDLRFSVPYLWGTTGIGAGSRGSPIPGTPCGIRPVAATSPCWTRSGIPWEPR
jgi:spermidine/putrescine transport system substrate-binding protein